MKKFKIKTSWIVVGILIIYLVSTFAFIGLQSVKRGLPIQSNIINYTLDTTTRNAIIGKGGTVIRLEYNDNNCERCLEQKFYLEEIAQKEGYKNQIILQEIVNSTVNLPEVSIMSIYGNKTLTNATEDEIFNSLCELMTFPPISCVAKQ